MRIFITGGAGFIGSHIALQAKMQGHEVRIYDNFSNSSMKTFALLGDKDIEVMGGDILDQHFMKVAMMHFQPELVIHCAALKDVAESERIPLQYHKVNVEGTIKVVETVEDLGIPRLMFSSSAAIYGDYSGPIKEDFDLKPTSAYGRTKMFGEQFIADFAQRGKSAISLRYFNPVAANRLLLQKPTGTFMSNLVGAASGRLKKISLFNKGDNVRDFIHVEDLVDAHLSMLNLDGHHVFNIGTGAGFKMKDILFHMELQTNRVIPNEFLDNARVGDIEVSISDCSAVKQKTGWEAIRTMEQMCRDSWEAESSYLSSER